MRCSEIFGCGSSRAAKICSDYEILRKAMDPRFFARKINEYVKEKKKSQGSKS